MNTLLAFLAQGFPRSCARIVYGAALGPMIAQGLPIDMGILTVALDNVAAKARGETVDYGAADDPLSMQELTEGLYEVLEPALAYMKVPLTAVQAEPVIRALGIRLSELHPPVVLA